MSRSISEAFPGRYFKADDLKGRRRMLTIDHVVDETIGRGREAAEKPVVYFKNEVKGLVLNVTNGRTIALVAGSEQFDDWTGIKITLYATTTRDPSGKRVACVRVLDPTGDELDDDIPTAADDQTLLDQLRPSTEAS